jgi:hypothetical protein
MGRRPPSVSSSANSRHGSIVYFHKPSLGDKLQLLAAVSPKHLHALELLVDLILKRLKVQV